MCMSQCLYPVLIAHKRKVSSKCHYKILNILDNLIFHNSLIHIFYIPCTKFLNINKV